ncbi:uncharacterized protein [Antennarius striatus]|uniref:uncharacterized protein isoform X2 n=1 Tax=Antennarius striatus TaxID=241820 RepID=UPI0035B36C05
MSDVSLFDLLNLSIGTPQSGTVNFSALHALLHAILRQLDIREMKTGWKDTPPGDGHPDAAVGVTAIRGEQEELQPGSERQEPVASSPSPTPSSGAPGERQWRLRVQTCEEDVSKMVDAQAETVIAVTTCCRRVDALEEAVLSLKDAVQKLPEELSECVKWDVLQAALLRDGGRLQEEVVSSGGVDPASHTPLNIFTCHTRTPSPPRHVEDADRPDTPTSSSASGRILSNQEVTEASGEPQVSHPDAGGMADWTPLSREGSERYPETVEALRSIGTLKEKFDGLEARLAELEERNVEQSQLEDLRELISNQGSQAALKDLEDQLQQQRAVIEGVTSEQERNLELVNDGRKMMLQLQAECEKLHESTRCLREDSRQRQSLLEKADKSALDSKVSRLQFDSVTDQLSSMFHELLNKVTGQEQDWHQVIDRLSTEMACKLNRIELDSMKKQLEGRWRDIHQKLQAQGAPELEDAAALRKQLVDRFHCLSCDRPVVKYSPGPQVVTLPSSPGFPAHKSIRPFTVYALEQFRQHYRSERLPEPADYSHVTITRSCGGSHTITPAGQRRSGLQSMKHQTEVDGTTQSEEIDIIGLDGHIYKGRLNAPVLKNAETKLPTIPSKDGSSKAKDRNKSYKPAASPEAGLSGLHPISAKSAHCSRSASSSSGRDWPVSALGCTSHSSFTQASAAAWSNAEADQ